MESVVKESLKSLCCSNGWSYGVLWLFDQQNPMFLTLAEAHEDRATGLSLIDEMLLQVHILGQGIVGEAAFTGKDQWIHSDVGDESLMSSVSYQVNEVETELRCQFASGIKTVVAIPLESYGVVQFGSTKKVVESLEFADQTKKLLLENISIRQGNASMSSFFENYGSDNWLDLLFSNEVSACKDQILRPSGTFNKLVDPDVVLSEMVSLDQLFSPESPFPLLQQDFHSASTYSMDELFDAENSTRINSGLLAGGHLQDVMNSDFLDFLNSGNLPSVLSNECPVTQLDSTPHAVPVVSKDSSNYEAPIKLSDPFSCLANDFNGRKELTMQQQQQPMVGSCVSSISELDAICASRPRKGLFSELGLEQLLSETAQDSASADRSSYDDPYSTSKKRKMGCGSTSSSQIQSESFSCLSDRISSFQRNIQKVTKHENLGFENGFMLKPEAGLWIDDSYNINAGSPSTNTNTSQARRTQESTKPIKKRARPGESTRPRPKDRQQFQDRLVELRKMIPNTGKCSIDALLECTIKHMLFLQNVTKYAEKLKRISEQKENGSISKNNANGVTWAFEMCDQSMMCPIKVEDVGSSGQMLIEMLCENGGTFLEISNTIRGFGLCILQGSMEDRNDKTWAYFIVEPKENSSVTRVDVFWSLAQHLQQSTTTTTGTNSIKQQTIKVDETNRHQSEYRRHQQNVPQLILTEARR